MNETITGVIIKEAIEISKEFGRGLTPAAFVKLLDIRLSRLNHIMVERNKVYRPRYFGEIVGEVKVDLVINDIAISIVSNDCENQQKLHELRSKMLLVGLKNGLIFEINVKGPLKDHVKRVVINKSEGGGL